VSTKSIDPQRSTRPHILLVFLLLSATSLSTSSSHAAAKGVWSDNVSRKQSFSRVLIVGISPNVDQRCPFERFLATSIKSEKTVALVSCDVMQPKTPLTREGIEATVAAQNADAVLATSLISKTWEAKEGGTYDTRGGAYYKATDSYYGVYGTVVAADFQTVAPLTSLKGEVHVTSKLYETRGETVVYTVDTKVSDIGSTDAGLAALTPQIAKRLRKDGLIR